MGAITPSASPATDRGSANRRESFTAAALMSKLQQLPPFPAQAVRALEVLTQPDFDIKKLTGVVAADPVFAAETLRLVNSSLYGRQRPVSQIRHAITMIGRDRLYGLIVTTALRTYAGRRISQKPMDLWWRHSLACAVLADGLADVTGQHRSRAYTAGLLHDIGRLGLLMLVEPASFLDFLPSGGETLLEPAAAQSEEAARWGADHCEIGLLLIGHWNLPEELAAVAALHHIPPDPSQRGECALPLTTLIHDACQMASHAGFATVSRDPRWSPDVLRARLPAQVAGNFELDLISIQRAIETKLSRL
jgi:HD-like signal output (HDOD) protein